MVQAPPRKRPKRVVPFLEAHEYLYGVRVVERDPFSNEVASVLCMFCAAFGREDDPQAAARQRARTQKPKYWGGPCFRSDNYKSHLTMQHPARWKQYQMMPAEQKRSYFDAVPVPPKQQQPRRSLDHAAVATITEQTMEQATTPADERMESKDEDQSFDAASTESSGDSGAASVEDTGASVAVVQSPATVAVTAAVRSPAAEVFRPEVAAVAPPVALAEVSEPVELEDEHAALTFLLDRDVVNVALGDVLFEAGEVVNGDAGKVSALFENTLDQCDEQDQEISDGTAEYRAVPQRISMLCIALAGDVGVDGPLPEYQRAALRDQSVSGTVIGSNDGMFTVKPHSIVAFVRGMDSWVAELFDTLSAEEHQKIIVTTADRVLELVHGLHGLTEELEEHRGSSTTSLRSFPPVLPHQVAMLHPVDFQEIIRLHRARLTVSLSDAELAAIETQHHELRTAATSEAAVRQLLNLRAEGPAASFYQAWEVFRSRWRLLAEFCGGLATVFPSSKSDRGRSAAATSSLASTATGLRADLSLEARLQCQQFARLQAVDDTIHSIGSVGVLDNHF
ncbi:uncharacterized protein KRP23_3454 [Phytophthora ramorum]|uniref:uncharacterized protein n=1 Tax=Phytophthora ramorum TaxID=164328 RepID=UPI0030B2FFA4|nr:hypothetical protein KRP23_3454 [Phytophthora ramorum]